MPNQRSELSTLYRRALALGAASTALMVAGCGSPSASPRTNHLASIQSAVTCPAPPTRSVVTNPSRIFRTAPVHVIARNVGYCAYIATSRGILSVRLRPEYAPNAVNDFVFLAEHGFYDGLAFYQVCPDATGLPCPASATAALAGDPSATGIGGPGYTVKADPVIGQYLFGAVAMYGSDPRTIGSQFLVSKGDSSGMARKYDIFGQVTDGIPALAVLQKGDTILWVAIESTAPEP